MEGYETHELLAHIKPTSIQFKRRGGAEGLMTFVLSIALIRRASISLSSE